MAIWLPETTAGAPPENRTIDWFSIRPPQPQAPNVTSQPTSRPVTMLTVLAPFPFPSSTEPTRREPGRNVSVSPPEAVKSIAANVPTIRPALTSTDPPPNPAITPI